MYALSVCFGEGSISRNHTTCLKSPSPACGATNLGWGPVGMGVVWVSEFSGLLPVGWWLGLLVAVATNGFLGDY